MLKSSMAYLAGLMATINGGDIAKPSGDGLRPLPMRPIKKRASSSVTLLYRRDESRGKPGDKLRRKAANGTIGLAVLR